MITKETAYKIIEDLVQRFEEQILSYKKSDYNEAQTRKDFIDPFFKALGWDMDNSQGHAEAYREVINEDRVKVGAATKAPDYSFKLPGGKRLFFVEAKKPSVSVRDEILPAYQVRRYAWSAKLPISILTDFEEFAIYDCTKKPNATDKASVARIKYLTFKVGYNTNCELGIPSIPTQLIGRKYIIFDNNTRFLGFYKKEPLVARQPEGIVRCFCGLSNLYFVFVNNFAVAFGIPLLVVGIPA